MTRTRKPMRGRRPTKRIDLTDVKSALADGRQWAALGVVVQPSDGAPHWQVVGGGADIMVELELQPTQESVTARLAAGMWIVPDVGDEVAVILPAGELDFMPVITCVLSHVLPSAQGPQPGRIVIASGEVFVHDGAGGAVSLALKSDVQAVIDTYNGHTHPDPSSGFTGPPAGAALPHAPQTSIPDAIGTEILKGK